MAQISAATFRQNFPEFADTTRYPDAQVNFWLAFAERLLPQAVWEEMWDYGIQLVAAHQITLASRDVAAGAAGGAPGAVSGGVSSKSVGGVSVSYDVSSVSVADGGYWNMTRYGIQALQLILTMGTGGYQL